MGDTDWYMDRDLAAAMNLYFADPATDSYDLKAEQSALARLKQVSGNAGSIVQYKPANRQDEAVLRRNRRIELMKPVPVERLRFKCSCGAGDARADKASKTLAVCGKACTVSGNPALSSAGCLVHGKKSLAVKRKQGRKRMRITAPWRRAPASIR